MKPQSPLSTHYKNTAGQPDRKGHRCWPFVSTCEVVLGYPKCMTAAVGGVHGVDCTCPPFDLETLQPVTPEQHAACEARGWEAYRERNGSPCDDCAMRPGSPEMADDITTTIARQKIPFRCHQGMPLRYLGEKEESGAPKVSYEPSDQLVSQYPPCNGWAFFRALGTTAEVD